MMTSIKYKSSTFYFALGNLPSKLRSRLCDINLVMLFPATLVSKYGYQSILQPFIEDLEKLETGGIKVVVDGLVVQALDFQSRSPVFKTTGWLQCRLSLSSFRGQ